MAFAMAASLFAQKLNTSIVQDLLDFNKIVREARGTRDLYLEFKAGDFTHSEIFVLMDSSNI